MGTPCAPSQRHMTRRWLVLSALAALAACEAPTAPGDRDNLLAARARWQTQGSTSYTFEITRSCFCLLGGRRMAVSVRNGAVSGAEYLDSGGPVELTLLTYVPTIPDLFDQIEAALDQRAAYFFASYDPNYGFPTRFEVDPSASAIDDELAVSVRNLQVSQPGRE